jgi:elongation factor P
MIDVNALRKGVTFEIDDKIYKVLEYTHHKPGRGKATIRTKVRNLRNGKIIDMSFNSGDRVQDIRLEHHDVEYLYSDSEFYYFMDLGTYEQTAINANVLEEVAPYLLENLQVKLRPTNHCRPGSHQSRSCSEGGHRHRFDQKSHRSDRN